MIVKNSNLILIFSQPVKAKFLSFIIYLYLNSPAVSFFFLPNLVKCIVTVIVVTDM